MVNGKSRRKPRALNLPKGRASALPRGNVVRTGLRGKKPLASSIVQNARRNQRLGTAPRSVGINVFGDRRKKRKGSILGFRMDGRTL